MEHYRPKSPETTSTSRKEPPFHVERLLRLNKASNNTTTTTFPAPAHMPSDVPVGAPHRVSRRRSPTLYTKEQMEGLEAVFVANQYPNITSREALADALDMTEAKVQVWFQNRRARFRRQVKGKASSSPPSTVTQVSDNKTLSSETPYDVPVEVPAPPRRVTRRRLPTIYTKEQMECLKAVFAANQYPDTTSRETLARAMDITEARVRVWFHNRRARLRRQTKQKTPSPPPSISPSSSIDQECTSSPNHQGTSETSSSRPSTSPVAYTNISKVSASETEDMVSPCSKVPCSVEACPPPPIVCTNVSCPDSTPTSSALSQFYYSSYAPNYGLPQQCFSGGAFPYPFFPPQYAFYYQPGAYTSLHQGTPICNAPSFL